jgi:hypothetical protein
MRNLTKLSKRVNALGDRFNARSKARHFAGRCVFVVNAFGHTTHQLWLSGAQSGGCGVFVAGFDCFFNFTQVRTDARTTGFVDFEAALVLTGAFFLPGANLP